MSKSFRIRKGVNIRLKGEAQLTVEDAPRSQVFAIQPPDFHGLVPKLLIKEGAMVKAGTPIFYDKYNERIRFVSPVSGEVEAVVRGAKRRILEIRIKADAQDSFEKYSAPGPEANRVELINTLLEGGCWPFVRQRPFSIIANPEDQPKAIFVSGFDSAPLAPDADFVMQGLEAEFEQGMKALVSMAGGKPVYLGVQNGSSFYKSIPGVTVNTFSGPHPAGNVGVQIHKISPINKGEVVWYVNPQDVANIGRFLNTGESRFTRTFATCGSQMKQPKYYRATVGTSISGLVANGLNQGDTRLISGDVLSGTQVTPEGFLGYYDHLVSAIPEGYEPQFFLTKGWLGPGLDKFSLSRSFPSWLMPNKVYDLNTNMNGEPRAYVVTGQYEKVFPFDIYPQRLVKAIITNNIDEMEQLGIYEVAPEDFALCEYACTSKIEVQRIVREGLDLVKEECA